jgi:hypothetical protein
MTATIKFKTKTWTLLDGSRRVECVTVPELKPAHCDMHAFRQHPRYGVFANSDLFPAMLRRIRETIVRGETGTLRLDCLPANITADTSGFLAVVTITV